jgi:adenylate cyclase
LAEICDSVLELNFDGDFISMTPLHSRLPDTTSSTVPADQVQTELDKILHSRVFHGTKLLRRLLKFVVDQTIAGNAGSLKESTLGVDVFERGPAFDPRMDPIVRVDARRLRIKLSQYYESEGLLDPLIVEVPKGTYAPLFSLRDSSFNSVPPPVPASEDSAHRESIAVLPFVSLDSDPESQYFSDGLTEEVITALARISGLRVIGRSTTFCYGGKAQDIRRVGRELNVQTVLEGSVRRTGKRVRISARLLDATDCFYLWSEAWEWDNADTFAVQKEISDAIEKVTRETFRRTTGAAS